MQHRTNPTAQQFRSEQCELQRWQPSKTIGHETRDIETFTMQTGGEVQKEPRAGETERSG